MNYRPYPNVDRALAQLERRLAQDPPAWLDEAFGDLQLTGWQKDWLEAASAGTYPRLTGRAAITKAIVDQAVKAGEHVHVAGRDGVRCAGGDDTCTLPRVGAG